MAAAAYDFQVRRFGGGGAGLDASSRSQGSRVGGGDAGGVRRWGDRPRLCAGAGASCRQARTLQMSFFFGGGARQALN
jgi:hypothetical protein